jgi:hypothetical protein
MKTNEPVELELRAFVTLTLEGTKGRAHWKGDCVWPIAGLDANVKRKFVSSLRKDSRCRPALRQSL